MTTRLVESTGPVAGSSDAHSIRSGSRGTSVVAADVPVRAIRRREPDPDALAARAAGEDA